MKARNQRFYARQRQHRELRRIFRSIGDLVVCYEVLADGMREAATVSAALGKTLDSIKYEALSYGHFSTHTGGFVPRGAEVKILDWPRL